MDVTDFLVELGGVARRAALLRCFERKDLDVALASGLVQRDTRGIYSLPGADEAVRTATALGGALSLTSAALAHGWAVKTLPDKPHVTVGRGRKLGRRAALAHVHWADLGASGVCDGITTQATTLRDCLRLLPFDEALTVADSALREGVGEQLLLHVAETARGPGSPGMLRVAACASGKAANAFESALRALTISVPGLNAEPQVTITNGTFSARPDLVDERLRIVCEADSFEWHGKRAALAADARRYNELVIAGWMVLRFSYEEVMFHPEEVRRVLLAAVALAELLGEVAHRRRFSA